MNQKTSSLIDSHCHLHTLDLKEFNDDLCLVINQAEANGVKEFLCVCIELEDLPALYDLANHYPNIYISAGIHPNVLMHQEITATKLLSLATHPRCIAIGETGLDYYRTATEEARESQRQRFREHIQAARISGKPLIVHTREAAEDTILTLRAEKADEIGGVMHCFAESWEVARQALDLNFYISFSGIVTFKNATSLQEVAKKVPLDRILIETDSPYLAPVPFRGKQNHPALVKYVALALSDLLRVEYETVAAQTTQNFYNCFKLQAV
ncbi:TatD family hydrolase [Legionella sp. 27cVA30]|uniref:TatD family deoxyribonuclease n=1 Tax=Legionella septentrionalis TaxID=2498109 RepID=A0A3S0V9X6_9GAMM|nr:MULTISPECIES: TatD family hydrolase [Legionella]MCP0914409.1 TatD family hydrolase [Legionella sp. 27cVA30]RUQ81875.1 TatD family deoxyribonuclease [Legionella septentrionalis]